MDADRGALPLVYSCSWCSSSAQMAKPVVAAQAGATALRCGRFQAVALMPAER